VKKWKVRKVLSYTFNKSLYFPLGASCAQGVG